MRRSANHKRGLVTTRSQTGKSTSQATIRPLREEMGRGAIYTLNALAWLVT